MLERFPFMDTALEAAAKAAALGEVPVGAVLVDAQKNILAVAHNRVMMDRDPTAHAEMLAIRAGCQKLDSERLVNCDLYVTLEPCAMCAQAIAHARIRRLYFGAADPKGGGVIHGARVYTLATTHHRPEVYDGIQESRCSQVLKGFFSDRR